MNSEDLSWTIILSTVAVGITLIIISLLFYLNYQNKYKVELVKAGVSALEANCAVSTCSATDYLILVKYKEDKP